MKPFLMLMTMMTIASTGAAQNGQAETTKKAFSRTTSVQIDIQADPAIIWALLTNADDIPRWNSTIVSMKGMIKEGEKIQLVSTVDPKRTFKLKVKSLTPEQEMIWADGAAPFFRGVRTYQLQKNEQGSITFSMSEKLGGLMFPMAAGSIPDFGPSFEQFAADLKKEAETIQQAK
jgi:hypothetical protein